MNFRSYFFCLICFLTSRAALFELGSWVHYSEKTETTSIQNPLETNSLIEKVFFKADSPWYSDILKKGYRLPQEDTELDPKSHLFGQSNLNFFPLAPILSYPFSLIMPAAYALMLQANLCFLLSTFLLYRLALTRFNEGTARWSVLMLCFTPPTFIFSSGLSESSFLLASLLCCTCFLEKRWGLAAVAGMATCLARPTGTLLPMLLGIHWLLNAYKSRWTSLNLNALLSILWMPFGLASFMIFTWIQFGDPFAYFNIRNFWIPTLLTEPLRFLPINESIHGPWYFINVLGTVAIAAPLLAYSREFKLFEVLAPVTLLLVAVFLSSSVSYMRYVGACYPIFLGSGYLLHKKAEAAPILFALFVMLNTFLMIRWTMGVAFAY